MEYRHTYQKIYGNSGCYGEEEDDVYKEEELDGGLFEEDGMRKKMHMKMRVVI